MDAITFTVQPIGQLHTLTVDVTALLTHLASVPDLRKRRGVRYPLAVLLTIAVLAKLCGANQVHAVADWARERAPELAALFGLARPQMPHPTTWTRVLGFGVTAAAVDAALQPLLVPVSAAVPPRASAQHAMDGKTLRGTIRAGAQRGVHLLSRYDLTHALVRHQVEVGMKANELTWAPHVVRASDLTGVLLTGDAMFAQRALSAQIVEAGGDYCWIIKGNQPTLSDDLRLLFGPQPAPLPGTSSIPDDFVTVRTVEKGHGRLDERILTVSSLLAGYHPWPYLAQAFQLIRITYAGRRRTREVRYGITSVPADVIDAAALLAVVRGHWQIENGLHYRRDVTLGEDASLVRRGHAPAVLATLNNLVCTLVAQAKLPNLAAVQRAMAAQVDRHLFRS